MHPALIYAPGRRLSLTELSAARLDGHVVEVGEAYMPADTVEGADARASSVAHLLSAGSALCGPSAAWIHGAGDRPPVRHHLRRRGAKGPRPRPGDRVIVHEPGFADADVLDLDGVPVGTREATAIELALAAHRDAESEHWLRGLLLVSPGLASRTAEIIAARGRVPGKRHAMLLLGELAAQEVVTR